MFCKGSLRGLDIAMWFQPIASHIVLTLYQAACESALQSARVIASGQDAMQVIGWENIELISDRPLETMLEEFKRLKAEYPGRHVLQWPQALTLMQMQSHSCNCHQISSV